MDISSKRWRVRTNGANPGMVEIDDIRNRQSRFVPWSSLGGVGALSMMKEADFDRFVSRVFLEG